MPDPHSFTQLLIVLVAVIVATKLLGEIAQRFGQPSVLGELAAGVLLGASLFGILNPADPVIQALAEIGILVLLFEIGLHTDLRMLVGVGASSVTVALVGVALPFAGGYWVASALGLATLPAIVAGAALTATSISISARVLSDLGQLQTAEGQIVLGAAVLDDIVGLIILSVVAALTAGQSMTLNGVLLTTSVAVGFVVAAIVIGNRLAPPLFRVIARLQTTGTLGLMALAFAFAMAWLADASGSAMIVGAFAAGLVLHDTPQRDTVSEKVTTIGHFFVPIFFATVGASVDLRTLGSGDTLMIGGALFAVGVLGKFAAGYTPFWFRGSKSLIGVAMIPRGEVGLIFAQMGLSMGAIDVRIFSALTLMVMATTFLTPPLLGWVARRRLAPANVESQPGDGGLDDLVAGASIQRERRPPPKRSTPA